jgi:hypothetical protein
MMSKYEDSEEDDRFHSGSFYSNPAFVCYYLIRVKPYSQMNSEI